MPSLEIKDLKWDYTDNHVICKETYFVCKAKGVFGFEVNIYCIFGVYEASGNYCDYYSSHTDLKTLQDNVEKRYFELLQL